MTPPRFQPTKYDGIFLHQGGNYWIRATIASPELTSEWVERSLKTKSITIAKDRADKIRRHIMLGAEVVPGERHTFDEVFDLVVKMQSNPSKDDDTLEQTKGIIDPHLRPWFRANCPYLTGPTKRYPEGFENQYEEVWSDYTAEAAARKPPSYLKSEERLRKWLADPKNQTPRKLQHDRRYLIMTLIRAHKKGWIKRAFDRTDFPISQITEPIGQYIENDDVQKLLDALAPYPRPYLQVLIALMMGMRKLEILRLHRDEIDLKRGEINLDPKKIKTRRRREVAIPIAEPVRGHLEAAYAEMKAAGGEYLFPAQYRNIEGQPFDWRKPQEDNSYYWDKVRAETGIGVRFHDLRHTAITNMLKSGFSETAVRKICGVSEVTIRRIYAHIETELKERFRGVFTGKFSVAPVAIRKNREES